MDYGLWVCAFYEHLMSNLKKKRKERLWVFMTLMSYSTTSININWDSQRCRVSWFSFLLYFEVLIKLSFSRGQ